MVSSRWMGGVAQDGVYKEGVRHTQMEKPELSQTGEASRSYSVEQALLERLRSSLKPPPHPPLTPLHAIAVARTSLPMVD